MAPAETIAKALGGRKAGGGWMARCPAHDDHEPSLSIRHADHGKALVHCLGGCDQDRVIAALRSRGLWTENGPSRFTRPAPPAAAANQPDRDAAKRSEAALAIWQSSTSANGTLVETYFAARGLHLPPSPALRFRAGLKHPSGGIWPTMVALVTRGTDGAPLAIHRTFLAHNGGGKAPVDPQKMMLGPCRGGAVRLADPGHVLMVGEGIETCLSAMLATSHPALGGAFDFWASHPRSAEGCSRRDRAGRWRRGRRGGGAGLRLALEAPSRRVRGRAPSTEEGAQ